MSFEIKGIALFHGAFWAVVTPLQYHSRSLRNLLFHVAVATLLLQQGGATTVASFMQVGTRWRAQVRREGLSISKTFRTKAQASTWAREIEVAVDEGRNLDKVSAKTLEPAIIAHYRILREESKRPVRGEVTTSMQ